MTPLVAERLSYFPCFAFVILIDGISVPFAETFNNERKKAGNCNLIS